MNRFAVVGNPILHSKSPFIFKEAYHSDYSYLRIFAQSADEALKLFNNLNIQGMNVTAPFKKVSLWGEGVKSSEVEKLGFTNTIVRCGNNLKFYNTDIDGIDDSIGNIENKKCVVIGAGGAGYAAAYSLSLKKADVTIVNRTTEKAKEAAKTINCNYAPLNELDALIDRSAIIVNTVNANVINSDKIKPHHIIIDAIYHNSYIKKDIANYIGGERWLINQGVSSYRIFTGKEPDKKAMERVFCDKKKNFSFFLVGKVKYGAIIAMEVSKKLEINITFHDNDNFNGELTEDSIVIWLFSELDENESSKEDFFRIASMVMDITNYTKEQIIEIIYGEISKTISY